MARRLFIASSSNGRLKAVRRLARTRRREALVVEGARAVRCALDAGASVRELYAAPQLFLGDRDAHLVAAAEARGAAVVELGRDAFLSIAGNARADGLLAVVARPPTSLARLRLSPEPLLLVVESIDRPGNLGAMVRTACAAGADALLVCDRRTDIFHPEVVRGSVGTIFRLPVAETVTPDAIAWLRERGVRIVVATPEAKTPHWDVGGGAFVVGNERYGLSDAWRAAADELVRIPMPGPADSLNVAVAAGILLFADARPRSR